MNYDKNLRRLLQLINLESDLDEYENIHDTIEKDLVFKGTNLWILVFAILVASVGLNMNSTAVIIGAMLISPLMGPINGMGYSIATYDFPLFRHAVKNLTFAIIAGLIASTAYFAITPISTAHSELLARTSPTIYDVLIAFFGGMAGIVAITSKKKGNVIPGVAIATALMPPLCTAGYGLATAQFAYFFGAMYLFTINTVFIAFSSLIMSQILKLPIRRVIDESQKKRINRMLSVVIALVLIPSIYFGYNLVQQEKFIERAGHYIESINVVKGNYLLNHDINPKTHVIRLVYGGTSLTEVQKEEISSNAAAFSLNDATIDFRQGFSYTDISLKNNEVETLKSEINRLSLVISERDASLSDIASEQKKGGQLLSELAVLYPMISGVSFSEVFNYSVDKETPDTLSMVVVTLKGKPLKKEEEEKIQKWLVTRLGSEKLRVLFKQ